MSNIRFSRVRMALGSAALEKLQHSTVAVVGIGAVGGYATEALARTGIGRLRLIDIDFFQEHNINRQIFATSDTVGIPKVQAARERLLKINPDIEIEAIEEFAHTDTLDYLLHDQLDFVVDAIDSVSPKIALLSHCHQHKLRVISSMGAALKRRYDLIRICDISQTQVCPLARCIRKGLRRKGVQSGIPVIYSPEPGPPCLEPDEIEIPEESTITHRGRPRRVLGSICTMAGVFGFLAAHHIIQHLTAGLSDIVPETGE